MGHERRFRLLLPVVIFLVSLTAPGRGQELPEQSTFPQDARELFVLARDAWTPVELAVYGVIPADDVDAPDRRLRQACVLLEAALQMDPADQDARLDYLMLLMSDAISDPGRAGDAIVAYTAARPNDSAPVAQWMRFRFNQLNDRDSREQYLRQQIPGLGNYPALQSDAYTQLGILLLETAQTQQAQGAFQMALRASSFNEDAFAQGLALAGEPQYSQDPQQRLQQEQDFARRVEIQHILRWRMRLQNNPFDLQATLNIINLLEQAGRHDLTAAYYRHALDILQRDPAAKPRQYELSLQQLSSLYYAQLYPDVLDISQNALRQWPDDIPLAALRILALRQLSRSEQAQTLARECQKRLTENMLRSDRQPQVDELVTQAWFYAFIDANIDQSQTAAKMALELAPQSPRATILLAWSFLQQNQSDAAKTLLDSLPKENVDPLIALVRARLLYEQGQSDDAKNLLLTVKDIPAPGVNDVIMDYLAQWAPQEAPAPKPESPLNDDPDPLKNALQASFSGKDLDFVNHPNNFLTLTMRFDSDIFGFGDAMPAALYLTYTGDAYREPISLGPNQAVDPLVLTQAVVEALPPGMTDLQAKQAMNIPEKMHPLAIRYLFQQRLLKAGRANQSLDILNQGFVRRALRFNPQQACRITVQAILEPMQDAAGQWQGRLPALQPAPVMITRKAFNPTPRRMASAFRRIRSGAPDERIETTRLFAALIAEASLAHAGKLNYQPQPIDIQACFNAIVENLTNPDPRVRAWSAFALRDLPLTNQPRALQRLGDLLTDGHWFPRFMAIYALQNKTDLSEYYQWSKTNESNPIINRLILTLTDQPLDIIELPVLSPQAEPATEEPILPDAAASPMPPS